MLVLDIIDKALTRSGRRMDQMCEMLHVTGAIKGLEKSQFAEPELRTAMFMCAGCRQSPTCQKWLAQQAETQTPPPDFCPNRERFKQLAAS